VTLVTRAAKVELLHEPTEQRPCNQVSTGLIMEELELCKNRPVRADASIHCASGLAAMESKADWH